MFFSSCAGLLHRVWPKDGAGQGGADNLSAIYFLAALSDRGILARPRKGIKGTAMLYTLLCYNKEDVVWSWTREEDDAVMARLSVVHEKLMKEGKLGPSLRLLPTTAAATLRGPDLVIDGPFAETKEQLLGFYVIDVENLDAALDVARQLSAANPTSVYEIRPVALYVPDARPDAPTQVIRTY
jgi:hypothetical protein